MISRNFEYLPVTLDFLQHYRAEYEPDQSAFQDSWGSLVGNCDELLYLGGNEKETHKYISELLGKETIDTNNIWTDKGTVWSYSTNFQQAEGSFSCRMKCVCWTTSMPFYLSVGNAP